MIHVRFYFVLQGLQRLNLGMVRSCTACLVNHTFCRPKENYWNSSLFILEQMARCWKIIGLYSHFGNLVYFKEIDQRIFGRDEGLVY